MTFKDIKNYFEKNVKITTFENEIFSGKVTGFEDELDTVSGNDEIELDIGKCYISIEIPDIKSISEIS